MSSPDAEHWKRVKVYNELKKEVAAKLVYLRFLVDKHLREDETLDWGHIGDLGTVLDWLADSERFLGESIKSRHPWTQGEEGEDE